MQVVVFMSRKRFWNLWFHIILGWLRARQISIFCAAHYRNCKTHSWQWRRAVVNSFVAHSQMGCVHRMSNDATFVSSVLCQKIRTTTARRRKRQQPATMSRRPRRRWCTTVTQSKCQLVSWQPAGQFPSLTVNQWLWEWLLRGSYALHFHFPFLVNFRYRPSVKVLIAFVHLFHLNVCEMTNRGISDSSLSSERALKNTADAAAVHSEAACLRYTRFWERAFW